MWATYCEYIHKGDITLNGLASDGLIVGYGYESKDP